jgi:alpha-aminoadipic semialdehyde synthase
MGAELSEDLSRCDFIIGVKEILLDALIPGKPHLFFSHTIKGQDYNMPLLQKILDENITLLDYEKILDSKNRRLIFFGKFAGNAGMVDTLYCLGQRLKQHHGLETPFLKLKQSYKYKSVQDAIEHLKIIGKEIKENGLPKEITPLNIFLLGYGHVASGCKEILGTFPAVEVNPENFETHQKKYENNKVYFSIFKEKHLVERKDGSQFDLQHFFEHCSAYNSNISCDINGSVQATVKYTTPDDPVFIFNAKTGEVTDGFIGEGYADMAVDNLPCEFAREASDYFSDALMPFMEKMLLNDYSKNIENSNLPEEIKKACIAHAGKVQLESEYMEQT